MPQPKKPTTAQRVRVLEQRLAMVEDVLNFVVNAQERSNVVVAEMMLKSAGTNLEEFLASSGTSFQQEEDVGPPIKELTEEEAKEYGKSEEDKRRE